MVDTRKEIELHLSVLGGLELSGVHHAADMLTLGFGPLREVRNFKGVMKHVGQWAFHVQCAWQLEREGDTVASREDLRGPDEKAHDAAKRLHETLVKQGPITVESISADDTGGVVISFSQRYRLVVVPDGIENDEDWRFFAPSVDAAHFVIEGGKVVPKSLT